MFSALPADPLPAESSSIDRASHLRADSELIERTRHDPSVRIVVVRAGSILLVNGSMTVPTEILADVPSSSSRWIFVGIRHEDATPFLAYRATDDASRGGEWADVRRLRPRMTPLDADVVLTAVALDRWHASHGRCSRCGTPTRVVQAGWVRRCEEDQSDHYPRTDPAVIMAVIDDEDRLLLGHATHWPEHRFSTLAGYVEPGESLENAVRREVLEEVGVVIDDVVYRGSQPWPFPASLMLGFFAHAATRDLHPDEVEITDARWLTRPDLVAAIASGDLVLPSRTSIARGLIEEWYGGSLAGD